MSKIHILPDDVINKIAAGEVVERPASIVKELLENSLDAGATRISVEIKKGGKDLIRVSDNGAGMEKEDCLLAVQRHATSKIKTAADLINISSMGFRGEALASIAAVSRFSLVSCSKNSVNGLGTRLQMEGSNVIEVSEYGCPSGTVIEVMGLFFNVPARRKFLKTDRTETSRITEVFTNAALSALDVGFKLVCDGKELFNFLPREGLADRVKVLFGASFSQKGIDIDFSKDDLKMSGWLGKPELARTDRNSQYWFVNKRPVKSPVLSFALSHGYGTTIMHNRYPVAVVFLEISGEQVDVNVHPSKKEIRFADVSEIKNFVINGVSKTLQKADLVPRVTFEHEISDYSSGSNNQASHSDFVREATQRYMEIKAREGELPQNHYVENQNLEFYQQACNEEGPESFVKVIGSLCNLFVLVEGNDGLIIIDQHAAHERVLYENAIRNLKERQVESQALLIPMTVELSFAEASVIRDHIDNIKEAGLLLEEFGQNDFLVREVPAYFKGNDAKKMVLDLIDTLRAGKDIKESDEDRMERIIRQVCRSSVMANDSLNDEELSALIESLKKCEQPNTCPHGRPTMINLPVKELEKRFKRIL